eukprot:6220306-Amphidinium_carterae.2
MVPLRLASWSVNIDMDAQRLPLLLVLARRCTSTPTSAFGIHSTQLRSESEKSTGKIRKQLSCHVCWNLSRLDTPLKRHRPSLHGSQPDSVMFKHKF